MKAIQYYLLFTIVFFCIIGKAQEPPSSENYNYNTFEAQKKWIVGTFLNEDGNWELEFTKEGKCYMKYLITGDSTEEYTYTIEYSRRKSNVPAGYESVYTLYLKKISPNPIEDDTYEMAVNDKVLDLYPWPMGYGGAFLFYRVSSMADPRYKIFNVSWQQIGKKGDKDTLSARPDKALICIGLTPQGSYSAEGVKIKWSTNRSVLVDNDDSEEEHVLSLKKDKLGQTSVCQYFENNFYDNSIVVYFTITTVDSHIELTGRTKWQIKLGKRLDMYVMGLEDGEADCKYKGAYNPYVEKKFPKGTLVTGEERQEYKSGYNEGWNREGCWRIRGEEGKNKEDKTNEKK